jgi:opacity protein-like surface antigen
MEAMMKKFVTAAMAALTVGGTVAAAAAPAQAEHWRGDYRGGYYGGGYGYHHHDNAGPAIAAGVLGLALGAAIASNGHSYYYDRPYYRSGYYDYDYGYYRPRWCETTRWVWDPYIGERVPIREHYRC